MRLVVPYLLILLLISTLALSGGSLIFATFAALQIFGWAIAILGLRYKIPVLHRVAAPANALLVLKAAAVVGLYKFVFTRGPLWKIWTSREPGERTTAPETANPTPPEPFATAAGNDRV
jgi:hypothetical protein